MDKITPKIKSIELGYGEASTFYSTDLLTKNSIYYVDEIKMERKQVRENGWIIVYRCYKNGSIIAEFESDNGLVIRYWENTKG